ncbi:MAG: YlxR family protein [Dehalococcoidia bacterium]|nr:YlxR family protein [Dehalococcoidia bacterium]
MMQKTISSRKVPQRTCVACREVQGKKGLVRIVRQPEGGVCIDLQGRMNGRGAYLCAKLECWQSCFTSNRLDHVLKIHIAAEERARLLAEGRSLIGGG